LHHCSRKRVAETYLLATRCPVYRRHDSRSGSRTERCLDATPDTEEVTIPAVLANDHQPDGHLAEFAER